jgi:hypothetical protein
VARKSLELEEENNPYLSIYDDSIIKSMGVVRENVDAVDGSRG